MADSKLTALAEALAIGVDDLFYLVTDPLGTPTSKRVTAATVSAAIGGGSPVGVFDVTRFGATGNGSTDDTAAIQDAIDELEANSRGVLYFPPGDYKTDPFEVTVPCVIKGEGGGSLRGTDFVTRIKTGATADDMISITKSGSTIMGLLLELYTGTPTAGSAIGCDTTGGGIGNRYKDLSIRGFWTGIRHIVGSEVMMDAIQVWNFRKYGIELQNSDSTDGGDQFLSNIETVTDIYTPDAGIAQFSGGGLKIVNWKHNASGADRSTNALFSQPSASTSVLVVSNCSLEAMTGDAIAISVGGSNAYRLISIGDCEVGMVGATGSVVNIDGLGSVPIGRVTIDNITAETAAGAEPAFKVNNAEQVCIGQFTVDGYSSDFELTDVADFTRGVLPGGGGAGKFLEWAADDAGGSSWSDLPAGTGLLSGAADPGPSDGSDGQFWVNTTTRFLFGPKEPIVAGYLDAILLDNPTAVWQMNDASAPFVDSVGSNDLTVNSGSVTAQTGSVVPGEDALQFDPGGGVLTGVRPAGFSGKTDNFALEVLIAIGTTQANGLAFFVGDPFTTGYGIFISANASGSAGRRIQGFYQGVGFVNSTIDMSDDVVYHIVMERDSGTTQLYVDGSAAGATSASSPGGSPGDLVYFALNDAIMGFAATYDAPIGPTAIAAHFAAVSGGSSGGWPDGYPIGPPAGGTTGQVLTKVSNADYDYDWA
jgi:hypothetical protein